jgi:hypothetical protein
MYHIILDEVITQTKHLWVSAENLTLVDILPHLRSIVGKGICSIRISSRVISNALHYYFLNSQPSS